MFLRERTRVTRGKNTCRQALTGVAVVFIVIGNQQGIVSGGLRLVGGESLVLNFVELDHFSGVCVIRRKWRMSGGRMGE